MKFEWLDSALVKAITNGDWVLIDNANFCAPSVLDRLNSLLERNGRLQNKRERHPTRRERHRGRKTHRNHTTLKLPPHTYTKRDVRSVIPTHAKPRYRNLHSRARFAIGHRRRSNSPCRLVPV